MIRSTLAFLLLTAQVMSAEPVKPAPESPIISVIGLGACGKWMGAIFVTADGVVHGSPEVTAKQAQDIATPLGEHHSIMAMAPCIKTGGVDT